MRIKENCRRQQVEERKKAINEAERNRLESILKRNEEREARIEARRRNERSSVFAFGSSTPRMLEPIDSTIGSFWGARKATSTHNIALNNATPLTRRQSERELDGGSKKRATSAGGLERLEGQLLYFIKISSLISQFQPFLLIVVSGSPVLNFKDMRLSTSMYEIFHWDQGSDDPINKTNNPITNTSTGIITFDSSL